MSFLAPGFLIAAAAAALVVVGLHFISTREPRLDVLPTARFLPDLPVKATATTVRPSDLWLLLLRVLLMLLIGAALAGPLLTPRREDIGRIVVVDMSRAVRDTAERNDSSRNYVAGALEVIPFDSAARGSLSGALVSARRAAARVQHHADSLELVLVSPFVAEERDAATLRVRALWPGRITTVQVAAATPDVTADSIRIEWADSSTPAIWTPRPSIDTLGAIRAGDAVLVHPFVRRWMPASTRDNGARVIARWADGEPAAFEYAAPDACMRSLGFSLPVGGDASLQPEFQRFREQLRRPCGDAIDFAPLAASVLDSLRGNGPLARTADIQRQHQQVTPLTPWLLLLAALIALLELFARARRRESSDKSEVVVQSGARAA